MKYTQAQLNEMGKDELKEILSNKYPNVTIKGLWKMNKTQITEEILKLQNDENDEIETQDDEAISSKSENEEIQDEVIEDVKSESNASKKVRKPKHIFKAYDENHTLKFTASTLSEMFKFAHEHKICNRGWVLISMNDNVPVTMRIKKNETLEEYKKNPKVTSKYTGNFWTFTKEEA